MQCVNTKLVIILFFCTLGVPEVDNFNWYISEKCIILGDDLFQEHFDNNKKVLASHKDYSLIWQRNKG